MTLLAGAKCKFVQSELMFCRLQFSTTEETVYATLNTRDQLSTTNVARSMVLKGFPLRVLRL